MNKLFLSAAAAIALAFVSVPSAYADGPLSVWGGGAPNSSTYTDVYVPHVIDTLGDAALNGYVWGGVSEGTLDNARKVTDNPTNLAVGQLDILKNLNGTVDETGKAYEFTILSDNIGPECLYLVTNQSGYHTFGDFLGNAFQINLATGGLKSGSYGTYQNLIKLYPELDEVLVDNVGSALDIVNAVKSGKDTHGFFVMRPDPQSATFKAIADANLTIIPLVDYGLEDDYEFLDLKVANGWFFSNAKSVTTACTSVALITGSPTSVAAQALPPRDQKRLGVTIKRVSAIPAESLRPNISSWADMWDSLKVITAEQAKVAMDASKVALENILESRK